LTWAYNKLAKVKEKEMAKKRFIFGMLAAALVFAVVAVGCDNGDTWRAPASLVEVDGTWKASVKNTVTDPAPADFTTTTETERTLVIAAHGGAGSNKLTTVVKVSYTGADADADFWAQEKQDFITDVNNGDVEADEYTFEEKEKSITWKTVTTSTAALSQFRNSLLSPDGRTLLHNTVVYTKQ
jgi:hypothetical protein